MTRLSRLAVLAALVGPLPLAAAEQPARSRLCPEDLPEGVRLPPQPGCAAPAARPKPRREGVYDLGDGTTLQIGGRAAAEYGARR